MMIIDTDNLGASSLEALGNVVSVSPPEEIHIALAQTIPLVNATNLHATQLGGVNLTGTGQRVCDLDTGINSSHVDFGNRVVEERCICSVGGACCPAGNASDSGPGSAEDDHGHGTHVAGIIGASGGVTGIAPNVSLIVLK